MWPNALAEQEVPRYPASVGRRAKAEAPTQVGTNLAQIHPGAASLASKGLPGFLVELVLLGLRARRNV